MRIREQVRLQMKVSTLDGDVLPTLLPLLPFKRLMDKGMRHGCKVFDVITSRTYLSAFQQNSTRFWCFRSTFIEISEAGFEHGPGVRDNVLTFSSGSKDIR